MAGDRTGGAQGTELDHMPCCRSGCMHGRSEFDVRSMRHHCKEWLQVSSGDGRDRSALVPGQVGGDKGPYRQSERTEAGMYQELAAKLNDAKSGLLQRVPHYDVPAISQMLTIFCMASEELYLYQELCLWNLFLFFL